MTDLFDEEKKKSSEKSPQPLAVRMRPKGLDEFVGQQHVLGPGKLLRRAIESDRVISLILYGPPGTGKNALAQVIAFRTEAHFERLNAATAGVTDLRKIIDEAKQRQLLVQKKTILFLDEIHRFNKAQQDVLLPDVEEGVITLIGATTHNPYFTVNSALISRSLVVQFEPLTVEEIKPILQRALSDKERGLGKYRIKMDENALKFLAEASNGDARIALNALEVGVLTTSPDKEGNVCFTVEVAAESIQKRAVVYDADEDGHYDTISAFIKSMRGSDPDAVLYWLAKMIEAGEDPRFIARRIAICAAEDVGNADPQALVVANAAFQVVELVGYPEARIPLAQAAVYVASAPKSNAAYMGIEKALSDIRNKPIQPVPRHLRDSNLDGKGKFNDGVGYKYAHEFPGHYVEQDYLPEGFNPEYYKPTDLGEEVRIKARLEMLKRRKWKAKKGKSEN